jgi:hypothetical protein
VAKDIDSISGLKKESSERIRKNEIKSQKIKEVRRNVSEIESVLKYIQKTS